MPATKGRISQGRIHNLNQFTIPGNWKLPQHNDFWIIQPERRKVETMQSNCALRGQVSRKRWSHILLAPVAGNVCPSPRRLDASLGISYSSAPWPGCACKKRVLYPMSYNLIVPAAGQTLHMAARFL